MMSLRQYGQTEANVEHWATVCELRKLISPSRVLSVPVKIMETAQKAMWQKNVAKRDWALVAL